MIAVVIAIALMAGSVGLMAVAITVNQMDPNYSNALAIPFVNAASAAVAFLAMVIAIVAREMNRDSVVAKRTMVLAIVCSVILVVLFPIANQGDLSRFH